MKNFRTFNLAVKFYGECRGLPLKGSLGDQLKRASHGVALNLAEGYGRISRKDQRRFYLIALGSLRECQAIFTLEGLTGSKAYELSDALGAHLYKLIKNMKY